jgi:hypothetical protein
LAGGGSGTPQDRRRRALPRHRDGLGWQIGLGRRPGSRPHTKRIVYSSSRSRECRWGLGRSTTDLQQGRLPFPAFSRAALRCTKMACTGISRWRDPDSNRGHHDFQQLLAPDDWAGPRPSGPPVATEEHSAPPRAAPPCAQPRVPEPRGGPSDRVAGLSRCHRSGREPHGASRRSLLVPSRRVMGAGGDARSSQEAMASDLAAKPGWRLRSRHGATLAVWALAFAPMSIRRLGAGCRR